MILLGAPQTNAGLVMHELFHNVLGLEDVDLQIRPFGRGSPEVGSASENIGRKLGDDCFSGTSVGK